MGTVMARPKKKPEDRRTASMKIPLTEMERQQIIVAAELDESKPVTWARETLLRIAKRRTK